MTDRRHARSARTRESLLSACREAMKAGIFRPPMAAICKAVGVSIRSGFQHYGTIDALWTAAIEDPAVSKSILAAILQDSLFPSGADCDRLVRAAVFGRVT